MEYTIRIQKDPKSGWLVGQCEQLPEAITQGKDMEELMFMMKDAIELVLECKRDEFRELNPLNNIMVRKLRLGYEKKPAIKTLKRKRVCAV